MGLRRVTSMLAAALSAAALATAASGERTTVIGFSIRGNAASSVSANTAQVFGFVARATMRNGDKLVIQVTRGGEAAQRPVSTCSASPCFGSWKENAGITDRFNAVLKRGGAIVSRSRTITITWPHAPPFLSGHYEGKSSFNEKFDFDVSADGRSVGNLVTGAINEECNPRFNIGGGELSLRGPYAIASDGSFRITGTINGLLGNAPAPRKIVITGRIVPNGSASGTIRTDTTFTVNGINYTCNSGNQTWNATKVG